MKKINMDVPGKTMTKLSHLSLQSLMILGTIASPAMASGLKPLGTYSTGIYDDSAATISTYDALNYNIFVTNKSTNQIDILNIKNPTSPSLIKSIKIKTHAPLINNSLGSVNSVDFSHGILAAAVENKNTQDPGQVLFFNANGHFLNSVNVGALPDMLTFTPDGKKLLVANEGEPSDDYLNDPKGSVSIIDLARRIDNLQQHNVTNVNFDGTPITNPETVRIFGPNASVAQDLEPEYITVADDGTKAWVTLQENNAIAILNLENEKFEKVVGLGFKDHSLTVNGLDASDRDGKINITTYDNLHGIYQPDEIASYHLDGKTYLVTANEGDSRQYEFEDANGNEIVALDEEARVGDVKLDPTAFPNAEELQKDEVLGTFRNN